MDRSSPEYREKNRVYQNAWYHQNKASALASRKRRYETLREQVREYKVARGCSKCPENHPDCLEFHHPDPSTKDVNPADLVVKKGWSFEKIMEELSSLVVLCANCHRKEHARLRQLQD